MLLRTRIAAVGCAAALLLSPVIAGSAQAQAPLAGPLVPAAAPSSQATAAANWIADQWKTNPAVLSNGGLADAIASLSATGLHTDVLAEMNDKLKTQAPTYATSAGAAGKVAIAAIALGEDPTNYGGVDLIQVIQDRLATTPNAGGMFNLPYAVIALVKAGETVPQASIDAFVNAQDSSGAFGYTLGSTFTIDVDSTGVAITALVGMEGSGQGGQAVTDALDAAIAWAQGAQAADGSWPGYSPSNATALVGQGLIAAGVDVSDALAYLHDQQTKTGGAGLPSSHNGTSPNLMATVQGLLLLAGDDLLNVPTQDDSGTSTPPATTDAPTTTTPVTTAPVTSNPATTPVTSTPATTPNKPGALPNTGADGSPLALLVGLGMAGTAATAVLARRRPR
ncbi:LPXTG cell wall anchor domain-containing protein [Propionibacteriaceae bacterium Y1923]|uniref:LPXTG cell wall anchor domain-containing protein n=1 Tax=Aestuariimicrobium sp. Y1814 TaxID=3418742 RepID=UPI003C28B209